MKNETRRVSRFVSQQVWAIRESTLDVMVEILRMRSAGIELTQEEIQARIGAGPVRSVTTRAGSVGVLGLYGVISPRMNMMTQISGGTSLDQWLQAFRQLRDDPDVASVVIDGDTPGGSVHGLIEAGSEIFKAREIKPIIGQVNHVVASAGLWLMSACSEIVCSPSGEIGSLGCYMVHEDWSKANEMMGVKPRYISYGKYKTEGNFDNPLDDEAEAYLQAQVDRVGQRFEKTVSKYRDMPLAKVRSDFGQGRMLMAEDALDAGLIDRIGTLDETIARMVGGRRRSASASVTAPSIVAETESGDADMTAAKKKSDMVDPDDAGNCPEGYEKKDDGMCHLMPEEEAAAAAAVEDESSAIIAALSE